MRVYFTDEAEADLEEIADYIALDNPDRAVTFVARLNPPCAAVRRSARCRSTLPAT